MIKVLELIRKDRLMKAKKYLYVLEKVFNGLSAELQLRVYYNLACVESCIAEKYFIEHRDYESALNNSCEYLKKWLAHGFNGAWENIGDTARNELFRMSCDSDLHFVFLKRRDNIMQMISLDYQDALSPIIPLHRYYASGGGCIPCSTLIRTPSGQIPIEELREGDSIYSLDIQTNNIIVSKINNIYSSQTTKCIRINDRFLFTPSQPVCLEQSG